MADDDAHQKTRRICRKPKAMTQRGITHQKKSIFHISFLCKTVDHYSVLCLPSADSVLLLQSYFPVETRWGYYASRNEELTEYTAASGSLCAFEQWVTLWTRRSHCPDESEARGSWQGQGSWRVLLSDLWHSEALISFLWNEEARC